MAIKTGIGYSPLTKRIFLGKQNPEKGMWVGNDKRDITNDFLEVAMSYFEENTVREVTDSKGKKNFLLNVPNDKKSLEHGIKCLTKRLEAIK